MTTVYTGSEFLHRVVDLSDGEVEIIKRGAIIRGCYVTELPSTDVAVKSGQNRVFVVPGSSDVGSWHPMGDAAMPAGITIDAGEGASGEITIVYKPIP